MTFTQARRELKARITAEYTRSKMAGDIGCSLDHLSHVLAGRKSFGFKYAPLIEEKFSIPMIAWRTRRKVA